MSNRTDASAATFFGELLESSRSRRVYDTVENFVPHPRTLVVCPDPKEEVTPGGLILPDQAQTPKDIGTVVAAPLDDPHYQVGDRVIFRNSAPEEVEFSDIGKCIILQYCGEVDDQILGRFQREGEESS